MTEPNDWNAKIIEEFRANEGRVGGQFEGAPLLLLHSIGARSGKERVNPMMYQAVGDAYAVFASKGGAPSNPDWYHNLIATPDVRDVFNKRIEIIRAGQFETACTIRCRFDAVASLCQHFLDEV